MADPLARALASLAAQDGKSALAEVVVVGDAAADFVGDTLPVRWIATEHPVTSPVARNIGIRATTSDWIAFLDADCEVAPGWLGNLLRATENARPVIGGGVAFGRTSYWAEVHNVSMLHDFHVSTPAGPRPFLPTLNLLVRRDVITRVGLMDEALRRAQDLEWTARMGNAGIPLWFEPQAVAVHYPARRPGSLWRDYFETGQTSYRVRRQSGGPIGIPRWLAVGWRLRLLSPAVAAAVTYRIFARNGALARYWGTAPGIWFTKLAWCLGAASAAG
jgi:GT2 family glycosyltransferase